MLTHEDNEALVRVGAGTPMGELMRRYWIPFLPTADLPPDERPRIELLDEHGPAFKALVEQVRADKGADFTVCDIQVPTRPAP